MFERFTQGARRAVVVAQEEAAGLAHDWIGTEHVLLGVLADEREAARLRPFGLTADGVRAHVERTIGRGSDDLDPEALATLGINLDEVRRRVEGAFGPGALGPRRRGCRRGRVRGAGEIPFTPRAKKVLELALREAVHGGEREIRADHLLLGMLREGEGVGAAILATHGVTVAALRGDDRLAG
jgi:ATP-dependent Clp protease ATP-binding subunit ClpA